MMTGALVYKSINAVMRELNRTGISKDHTNLQGQYKYRSIDDLMNRLSPVLVKHKLCVLPRALDRSTLDRNSRNSDLLVSVCLKQAFDIVSTVDQSSHTVEAWGEALDGGDKGTAKAMSAAYKAAMLQTFCIPVAGMDDADAHTNKLRSKSLEPEPAQGWNQWVTDITAIIEVCETEEALAPGTKQQPEFTEWSQPGAA